jgi:hypothetical protein
VQVEGDSFFEGDYPWQHWDQMPEEFFDMVPPPWPSVDNDLSRRLTEIGFGKRVALEFHRDEGILTRELIVTESPPHFDSAPRSASDDLGLTVRDLTYEVRRYFQIPEGEPGVIVSKLEKGGKAAVAGLRPFELIISADDQAVHSAEEFGRIMATPGERRLHVRRMAEGRIVKLSSD